MHTHKCTQTDKGVARTYHAGILSYETALWRLIQPGQLCALPRLCALPKCRVAVVWLLGERTHRIECGAMAIVIYPRPKLGRLHMASRHNQRNHHLRFKAMPKLVVELRPHR